MELASGIKNSIEWLSVGKEKPPLGLTVLVKRARGPIRGFVSKAVRDENKSMGFIWDSIEFTETTDMWTYIPEIDH